MKLTLTLTPQELDLTANALALRPWGEVNALMVNIQQQVQEQQHVKSIATEPDATGTSDGPAARAAA